MELPVKLLLGPNQAVAVASAMVTDGLLFERLLSCCCWLQLICGAELLGVATPLMLNDSPVVSQLANQTKKERKKRKTGRNVLVLVDIQSTIHVIIAH